MCALKNDPLVITLRKPTAEDGASVFKLVGECPPLDPNSMYCNLLQCAHFDATSVAAVSGEELVGFVSGYLLPESPNTLFIWQVAVGEKARGAGLATKMINHILNRPECAAVNHIETTITEANNASWALFRSLARRLNSDLNSQVMFDRERHFANAHDSEMLVRIGPISRTV